MAEQKEQKQNQGFFSDVRSWVMENIKNLRDFLNYSKEVSFLFPPPVGTFLKAQKISEITTELSKPQTVETTTPFTVKETIDTSHLREVFNRLADRGIISSKEDVAFEALRPLFNYALREDRTIPSWYDIAGWQRYVDEMFQVEQKAREYASLLSRAGYLKSRGAYYTEDDILNLNYARNFEKIWKIVSSGVVDLHLPPPDINRLVNPALDEREQRIARRIVEDWIIRTYEGYRLMKKEPHPYIKSLYSQLTKEKTVSGLLEEEERRLAEDIAEEVIREMESRYFIQQQFLQQ